MKEGECTPGGTNSKLVSLRDWSYARGKWTAVQLASMWTGRKMTKYMITYHPGRGAAGEDFCPEAERLPSWAESILLLCCKMPGTASIHTFFTQSKPVQNTKSQITDAGKSATPEKPRELPSFCRSGMRTPVEDCGNPYSCEEGKSWRNIKLQELWSLHIRESSRPLMQGSNACQIAALHMDAFFLYLKC